jgi:hypothetical protein
VFYFDPSCCWVILFVPTAHPTPTHTHSHTHSLTPTHTHSPATAATCPRARACRPRIRQRARRRCSRIWCRCVVALFASRCLRGGVCVAMVALICLSLGPFVMCPSLPCTSSRSRPSSHFHLFPTLQHFPLSHHSIPSLPCSPLPRERSRTIRQRWISQAAAAAALCTTPAWTRTPSNVFIRAANPEDTRGKV